MTLIAENGTGVFGANSYGVRTYVTAYLTARGRQTENSWSTSSETQQNAACIDGAQHIENRFRLLFRGSKQFLDISRAKSTWQPTQLPAAAETVTLGSVTYTFVSSLTTANDVLIGTSLSATIDNLISAINKGDGEGTTYGTGTTANADATAQVFIDDTMVVYATALGTAGNAVATASSQAANPWVNSGATLTGGSDVRRQQPLSFPRRGLTDRDGVPIIGLPDPLLHAWAEYSVRARGAALAPDPTLDERGGIITKFVDQTGPLRTEFEYLAGSTTGLIVPNYPAADRLLSEYLKPSGLIR